MALTIKENGLPEGSGLYWKGPSRTQIWIRISHLGVVKSYPSGTDQWKKALQVRDKLKADLIRGDRMHVVNRTVRINELLDDYIADLERKKSAKREYGSDHAYKATWAVNKYVRPFFGSLKAAALSTKHLADYQDLRIAEYRKAGKEEGSWVIALNREFGYLRRAYKIGMEATPKKVVGHPKFPIDAKAEKLRARKGSVSPEQYGLMMAHAPEHLKPILPFVTYAGVRAKELKFIRREQVDWQNRLIRLRDGETKEGPGRDVPIVDVAVEPLKKWMAFTEEYFPDCAWLFHYNGERTSSWRTAWEATCKRAGLTEPIIGRDGKPKAGKDGKPLLRYQVKFHDTRRTAITVQGRAGVSEVDSQRVTGHRTVEVHRRYDQDTQAAIRTRDAVNEYLGGGTGAKPAPGGDALVGMTLKDLVDYRKEGMLTEEEFAAAKARILGR